MTIGQDIPPTGADQARFSPSGVHVSGKFFSRETPSCSGPRHWYQSFAITGVAAHKPAIAHAANLLLISNSRSNEHYPTKVVCRGQFVDSSWSYSWWFCLVRTNRRAFISNRGSDPQ